MAPKTDKKTQSENALPGVKKEASEQPKPAAQAPEPVSAASFPGADSGDRVSIRIEGGKVDYESLRSKTGDKVKLALKNSLSDPKFRNWAGLEAVAATPKKKAVTPALVGGMFDAAAAIEVGIFTKKYQLPADKVAAICKWSPEEHQFLDNAGADLLNKYIPESWLQYADIAMFAGTMLAMIKTKMAMLDRLSREAVERIGAAQAPSAAAPAPAAPVADQPIVTAEEIERNQNQKAA